MKIIKKTKILPTTCCNCGCVFQARRRDLRTAHYAFIREYVDCPVCNAENKVKFEKEKSED